MAEGGYEGVELGKLQTPHAIRKQAYWTQLAGGHYVCGHNECWKAPMTWKQWGGTPGAGQLQIFKQIITSRARWWNLVPDQSLLASGARSGYAPNTVARFAPGD